jgi:hypothetical protein
MIVKGRGEGYLGSILQSAMGRKEWMANLPWQLMPERRHDARAVACCRERDLDVDEEHEVDGGLDMYESRNSKVTKEKAVKRQRTSQIADLRRTNNALDNCNICFGSTKIAKHLTIALGQTAYLSIPDRWA